MTPPGLGTIVLYAFHAGGHNAWPAIVTGHARDDVNALLLTVFPEDAPPFALLRVQPMIFHAKEDRRGVGCWAFNSPRLDLAPPAENATA